MRSLAARAQVADARIFVRFHACAHNVELEKMTGVEAHFDTCATAPAGRTRKGTRMERRSAPPHVCSYSKRTQFIA